jgi:hypothetical protein
MLYRNLKIVFAILFLLFVFSCTQKKETQRSFCYWQTSLNLSEQDDSLMNKMGVSHLYLRFFDVDWNSFEKEALPIGTISTWWNGEISNQDITPSIFITNTVMHNCNKQQLDELAQRIKSRIDTIKVVLSQKYVNQSIVKYEKYYYDDKHNKDSIQKIMDSVKLISAKIFDSKFKEILIDCDWTAETKENYFYFLNQFKNLYADKYKLSATVRLWQFKYREKAGTPPTDRALLMCYNTQSPTTYNTENSIGSLQQIEQYFNDKEYPIVTDIALPIFSWGVLFKNKKFEGIITDITIDECMQDTVTYKQIKKNVFIYKKDMVVGDKYIRNGDELRIEQIEGAELEKIITSINKNVKLQSNSRITFFSWNSKYIKNYGVENIKKYYSSFNN